MSKEKRREIDTEGKRERDELYFKRGGAYGKVVV